MFTANKTPVSMVNQTSKLGRKQQLALSIPLLKVGLKITFISRYSTTFFRYH